jgi:hypothetical protein
MRSLKFPYGKMRDGQAALVKATYRTIAKGARLFASAPTGTGKTVATLYPAVRALGDNRCDKVFYLTPKTTTAMAAKDCIELMSERGADIRAIVLSSKDRSCQMGRVCKNGKKNCQNSRMNRLHEAVFELYAMRCAVITLDKLLPIAAKFTVCPYELELSYSELCDAVICDFNYLFDPVVYIRRYFTHGGRYAILVDEAHNLGERAREMYSAEISGDELLSISAEETIGAFSTVKKYILSYALLTAITYAIMLVGFLLLGIKNALLIALIVSLLDILPVIGVGTVLVPWSIFQLVFGSPVTGVGLIVLLIVHEITRQFAEPRIVGKSLGLHPIVSLILLYLGYSLFGFLGLFITPVVGIISGLLINKNDATKIG